jgi:hypothetical protein
VVAHHAVVQRMRILILTLWHRLEQTVNLRLDILNFIVERNNEVVFLRKLGEIRLQKLKHLLRIKSELFTQRQQKVGNHLLWDLSRVF